MIDFNKHYPLFFRFAYDNYTTLFRLGELIGTCYHTDAELKKMDSVEKEIEVELPRLNHTFVELLIEEFEDDIEIKFLCDELFLYLKSQEDILF